MSAHYITEKGHCRVLGSTIEDGGVNFAIYCKAAKEMELLLFNDETDMSPDIIKLSAAEHRTSYYFHVFVRGIKEGQLYAWRVAKVFRNHPDQRFDPTKVLLDPYCKRIIFPENYSRRTNMMVGSNLHCCPKSAVVSLDYDWEDDVHPNTAMSRTVIYEMHVKGFTAHPSSGLDEKKRGTYAGIIEKIPYLKELGITAIELLPVFQFDSKVTDTDRPNYWGYDPISFFVPHEAYSSDKSLLGPLNEFRDLVKALHKADIEIYLDVVYNHTSENGEGGPTFSFRGLSNREYYLIDENHNYSNFTGCGNTFNASTPVSKKIILDSLLFWSQEMHVDGFRFDLASILSRDSKGVPQAEAPTLLAIDNDYRFANTKIIAEAWDAAGLYQVGSLPGDRWREWNGQFRDVVRRFIKGEPDQVKTLAHRIMGSPDIYSSFSFDPYKSLNFITCHDGFTLWDLLCYNRKHNEANGEDNRDGSDYNFSWNHGFEGETQDKIINDLRLKQAKNLMVLNMLSLGTPMITMGDEILRTQHGNNNAYCQDNEISYMNWNLNARQKEMFEFVKKLSNVHSNNSKIMNFNIFTLEDNIRSNKFCLHGVKPYLPDFSYDSHTIGMTYYSVTRKVFVYMFVNAYWKEITLELPKIPNTNINTWYKVIDTSMHTPFDHNIEAKDQVKVTGTFTVPPRCSVVFLSENKDMLV